MAKALVLKGVNFAENKLDTISLIEDVPCTSISLDNNSLSLSNLGTTGQLTATALPSNTTDVVVWASSDTRIATVDWTGLVTVTGAGTATITASCGNKTATCTITTTVTIPLSTISYSTAATPKDYGDSTAKPWNRRIQVATADENYGIAYQETPALIKKLQKEGSNWYPVYFGKASTLTITAPNNIKVTAFITDSTRSACDIPEYQAVDSVAAYAVWLKADANMYDSNVSLGNRTITDIPEECDSVVIGFRKTSADLAASDIANVTVIAS